MGLGQGDGSVGGTGVAVGVAVGPLALGAVTSALIVLEQPEMLVTLTPLARPL